MAIGNVGGQNAALQTTSLGIRTRARNHQGSRPKIQSTSSDRSSGTAERLATKAQSDAERTAENGVGHSVRRCRPGNNLKATFGNQLTAHQIWVRMQVEMPGCDIGESTVRAYVRVRTAELDEQQTSSQAAAAWMMEVLHRDVPLRFIEKEFPSGAASNLAGIIKGADGGNERKL